MNRGTDDAVHAVPSVVLMSGMLDLRDAVDLHRLLQDSLSAHHAVRVDATDLAEADLSILQLLVAARKTAAATGRVLDIRAPEGGALRRLLAAHGLGGLQLMAPADSGHDAMTAAGVAG